MGTTSESDPTNTPAGFTVAREATKRCQVLTTELNRYGRLVGTLILTCENPKCPVRSVRVAVDDESVLKEPITAQEPASKSPWDPICSCCRQPASFVDFEPAIERETVRALQAIANRASFLTPP